MYYVAIMCDPFTFQWKAEKKMHLEDVFREIVNAHFFWLMISFWE